jgi:NADPH:quinone reductase-like Zn-dependent oxidoreductase
MTEQPKEELIKQYDVKAIAQQTRTTTERLGKIAGLVDQGAIKVQVDKVFPLEEASEALAYIQGGHRGKVVIKVK